PCAHAMSLPFGELQAVRGHALNEAMGIEDWLVYLGRRGEESVLVTVPKGDAAAFAKEINCRIEVEHELAARFGNRRPFEINHAEAFGEGRVSEIFGKNVPQDVDPRTPVLVTDMIPGGLSFR